MCRIMHFTPHHFNVHSIYKLYNLLHNAIWLLDTIIIENNAHNNCNCIRSYLLVVNMSETACTWILHISTQPLHHTKLPAAVFYLHLQFHRSNEVSIDPHKMNPCCITCCITLQLHKQRQVKYFNGDLYLTSVTPFVYNTII